MKYAKAQELAADLRKYADFIEAHGHKLHDHYASYDFSVYLTKTDYVRPDGELEYRSVIDEEATKQNIAQFLEAVGSCEKEWNNSQLTMTKKFGTTIKLHGTVNREAVCKKVPTGETRVIEAVNLPERIEELFEWVCEEPSLLRLTS